MKLKLEKLKMKINQKTVPVEISARHIHLSKKDSDILFGKNHQFGLLHNLSQPGQYSTKETVKIIGPKIFFPFVRIIGPDRAQTQLEISLTDSYMLGIKNPAIKLSGDLKNSSGQVKVVGPNGQIELSSGVIIAKRHLHIEPNLAQQWKLKNNDEIKIKIKNSTRSLVFEEVIVRSHEGIDKLALHIDTDEANAAGIIKQTKGIII